MQENKCKNCIFKFTKGTNLNKYCCIISYFSTDRGIIDVIDDDYCDYFESCEPKNRNFIEMADFVLRKIYEEDAEEIYQNWASDASVTRYLTWSAHRSVDDTREVIKKWKEKYATDETYRNWGIVLKRTGELIGEISLENNTIGYVLGKKWWNHGIMTKVLREVIDWAFTVGGYDELKACHDIENKASGRVMQKAGMTEQGIANDSYNDRVKPKKWYKITKGKFQGQCIQAYEKEEAKEDIDFYLTNKNEIDKYYPDGVLVIFDKHLRGHYQTIDEATQDMWNSVKRFPHTYTMVNNGVIV